MAHLIDLCCIPLHITAPSLQVVSLCKLDNGDLNVARNLGIHGSIVIDTNSRGGDSRKD
jgi:hypothetical protein